MNPTTILWSLIGFAVVMTIIITQHSQKMKSLDILQTQETVQHESQTKPKWK
jgi:hypothetical protein